MAAMTTVLKALIKADASQMKTQLASASTSLKDFGKATQKTGRKLTKNLTMPIVAVGGAGIKMASDFEASMTKIESLVGLSSEAVKGFEEDVRRLSGETAQAPKDLADAMFFITSAGIRGADATETLEAAAKAAAVGLGETATIADLATSALNAYGAENLSATDATDVMVAAVREGKLEADELAGSMGRVLPLASAMGVNFNEVGAAFAALSRTGTNAAEAATQVRGILSSLLRPTKQAEEALTGMGLSSAGLRQQIQDEGLLSVLKTLAERFDGQTEKAAAVFGNIRALSGVMDLLGKNSEATEAIFANMTDTTGALDDAFGVTSETTAFKLNQAMADMKMALIEVGEVLIPVIVPIIEKLAGFVKGAAEAFGKMPGPLKTVTTAFIGLAAALGPVMFMFGGAARATAGAIEGFKKMGTAVGTSGGKGLLGRMGGLLKVVKGHPVAFGAAAVAGVTLGVVLGRMRKNAKEARDRMNMLKQELVDSGDPTATMTDRVKELAEKFSTLGDDAEEAANEMDSFQGSTVLTSELIKRKVKTEFNDLGLDMKNLAELTKDGTDEFHKLGDQTKRLVNDEEAYIRSLKNADESIRDVTTALAEQIEMKQLTTHEARQIMIAIDETADAWDDYFKILEKQAEAYLKSDEGILHVIGSLGALGDAILEEAHETGNWLEAQEKVDHALQVTDDAINGNIGGWLGYNDVVNIAVDETEDIINVSKEAFEVWREEQRTLEDLNAEYDELINNMKELTDEAYDFAESEVALAEAFDKMTEALLVQDDPLTRVDERQAAILEASREWANELGTLADNMSDMPIDAMNEKFSEQAEWLETIREEIGEEEYTRLKNLLHETWAAADDLHHKRVDIIFGITEEGMTAFRNMVSEFTNLEDFGRSVSGFLGTGTSTYTPDYSGVTGVLPFANGGIVTKPTLGLIGEAGPEAVIPLDQVGGIGGGTNVTVNVSGSVLTEYDLAETIQNQLLRIKGRNASLEFG